MAVSLEYAPRTARFLAGYNGVSKRVDRQQVLIVARFQEDRPLSVIILAYHSMFLYFGVRHLSHFCLKTVRCAPPAVSNPSLFVCTARFLRSSIAGYRNTGSNRQIGSR